MTDRLGRALWPRPASALDEGWRRSGIMITRFRNAIVALSATLVTYAVARAADLVLLRVVHPPRGDVLLVSDVVLATAFGVAIDLWLNLKAVRTQVTGLERVQIIVDTQLALAAAIQRRLLPSASAGSNGVRWAGRLEPALRIGGDFYDSIQVGHDDVFVVGDVSGKGIPASLLQASAHSLFRTLAQETVDPAELLARISREIFAENAGSSYLTCVVVRVDCTQRTMTYVNAGHPAGVVVGRSGHRLLSRGGPPLGLFPETAYEREVLSLEPGDLGVIVSDGITEAMEEDDVTAADVLSRNVCRVPEPRTPERVCDALMQMAQDSAGPHGVTGWQDDKTVFAFRFDNVEVG
ncbi:MAG: proteincache protein [Acidobacteria bacterium]|jgi:sigma-B regulation protein RsbU (phosphoserine phosphatase)|nr:proteincache protein [Acidobacteriota bacterium]